MASRRAKARQEEAEVQQLLDEREPLDTSEQDRLVASLEAKQAEQERLGCGLLAALVGCLALLHAYLAARQLLSHWSTRQAAHFHGAVPFWLLSAGDALSAAAYVSSAALLLQQPDTPAQQQTRRRSLAVTAAACLFWLAALHRAAVVREEGYRDAARHAWLPLAPVGVLLLARHVLQMFVNSRRELRRLRGSMYDFKKA